jgi:two-component sensor histidine kinase
MLAKPEAPIPLTARPAAQSTRSGEHLRILLCSLLILLGLSVIAGWLFDIGPLKSILPHLSTMKFNTALAFVIAGSGLLFAGFDSRIARGAAAILGSLLLLLGGATLIEYVTGADLGIDQVFVRDTGSLIGSGFPGRMSLLTATAWSSFGITIGLLAKTSKRGEVILAHCLALIAGAVSMMAAAGYTFGAAAFWGIGSYTLIAAHTAIGLLVASAAALMTRTRDGWLQPYVASPAALGLLSRLLPVALGIPILLGMLVMLGAGLGAFNAPFGLALFIPLTSIAMALTALWIAGRQREVEAQRLHYQRHLQLVVAELNHRVKNTLSIVQSFAHQSLRSGSTPEEAASAFEGRLSALASAHSILTRENWDRVSLVELIGNSLDPHNDTGTRFAIEGPDLPVSPKTAITLAMTLHELATNSTKYGALSKPDGYVRVSWRLDGTEFHLTWKDCDGPPVEQPARAGFGSRMLRRALAAELDGIAELQYEPDGIRYEVKAPARAEL